MLLASLPDPASPTTPAFLSIVCGFLGTSVALARRAVRDDVRWVGFFAAYLGAGFGLLVYCAILIGELF